MHPVSVHMGRASNGTPVFTIPSLSAEFSRVFGATRDQERGLWMFPAYFPVADLVLADLRVLGRPLEFSPTVDSYIQSLEAVRNLYTSLTLPAGFTFLTKPFDHQVLGLAHIYYMMRAALFYAPGLGKSKIAIDWMRLCAHQGEPGMTLVLGPLVTIRNWGKEIDIHSARTLRWGAVLGTPEEKREVIEKAGTGCFDALLTTYETARNFVDLIAEKVPYTRVVCDECFIGTTQVLTTTGPREISEIVADPNPVYVLSINFSSGVLEERLVTRKWRRVRKVPWCRVEHEWGFFICTPSHQIWTEEDGYIPAAALKDTHHLRAVPRRWEHPQNPEVEVPGSPKNVHIAGSRVVSVTLLERGSPGRYPESSSGDSSTFDIEVEGTHNYFADGVLVSNSHRIKNFGASRSVAAFELGQKATRKVIMTGTPTLGNPADLYGQFKFLGSYFMPESVYKYRERFFEMSLANKHLILGYKNLQILNRRTALISLRRTKEQCLDLPEQLFVDVTYDMGRRARVTYNQLIDDMGVDVDALVEWVKRLGSNDPESLKGHNGQVYSVPQVAVLLNKLSQIRSGFLLTSNVLPDLCDHCEHLPFCVPLKIEPYTQNCYEVHEAPESTLTVFEENAALDALDELLDTILGDPTNKALVWCRYSHPGTEVDMICDRLTARNIKHTRVGKGEGAKVFEKAEAFNADPEQRVYVAQAATGEGITLNSANYTIFFNVDYALQSYLQPLDRNHRIGQSRKVTVYRMAAANSIDASIISLLHQKVEIDRYLTVPGVDVPRMVSRRVVKARGIQ